MAMATNYNELVKVICAANSITELANVINGTTFASMPVIDSKAAYASLTNGRLNNEGKALQAIFSHIASIYENEGKPAGISTIYNVLDGRIVRKVKFSRKLAINLGGSKALAEFIGFFGKVYRNTSTRKAKSVNGNEFSQNRNAYSCVINGKAVRKPQFSIKVLGTILANIAIAGKLALPAAAVKPTGKPIETGTIAL